MYGESRDIQIVRKFLEAITLTRAAYVRVWTRNAKGQRGKGGGARQQKISVEAIIN